MENYRRRALALIRLGCVGAAVLMLSATAACGRQAATPAGPVPSLGAGTADPKVLQAEFDALPNGDASAGKVLFTSTGCAACHSLQPDVRIVGPSLAGIATRAATRQPGYTAGLYLYESITRPGAYVVEGFQNGIMPQDFKQRLKPKDLADVIAFLLAQK